MSYFKKWMIYGVVGLLLIGAGLCCAIESAFLKYEDPSGNAWIWAGTASLIIFNAGVSFTGSATYNRVLHRLKKDQR